MFFPVTINFFILYYLWFKAKNYFANLSLLNCFFFFLLNPLSTFQVNTVFYCTIYTHVAVIIVWVATYIRFVIVKVLNFSLCTINFNLMYMYCVLIERSIFNTYQTGISIGYNIHLEANEFLVYNIRRMDTIEI